MADGLETFTKLNVVADRTACMEGPSPDDADTDLCRPVAD